jgi:hypothetical protein
MNTAQAEPSSFHMNQDRQCFLEVFDKAMLNCLPSIAGGHKNFWYDSTVKKAEAIESQALIPARSGAWTW